MNWWYVIGGIVFAVCLLGLLVKLNKERKAAEAFNDILYQPGNVAYVSPMAILKMDTGTFDPARVPAEHLDRVVRLRMKDVVHAIFDPATTVNDPIDRQRLCRYATVMSAILGESIPAGLILIDKETKQLFLAVRQRQKLIQVQMAPLGSKVLVEEKLPYDVNNLQWSPKLEHWRNVMIRAHANVDHIVQAEFLRMLAKNEYAFFHVFVTRVRQRITAAQRANVTDEGIQSIITAYAARTGLHIPQGYYRRDTITLLMMNWDNLPKPEAKVYNFALPKADPLCQCECGHATGAFNLGTKCRLCHTRVVMDVSEDTPNADNVVFNRTQ